MSFSMSNLIEKLNARDKDERYMAMHDLAADLDRDNIKLENEMERRVVNTILKHLKNGSQIESGDAWISDFLILRDPRNQNPEMEASASTGRDSEIRTNEIW